MRDFHMRKLFKISISALTCNIVTHTNDSPISFLSPVSSPLMLWYSSSFERVETYLMLLVSKVIYFCCEICRTENVHIAFIPIS